MALPSVGGGQQVNDGNLNELVIGTQPAPQTATATATLTAAQLTGHMLIGNPSASAASYTLPTVAAVEAIMVNAKVGSFFELIVVNIGTGSGVITFVTNTGWTLVGIETLPIITSAGSSARYRARKTAAGAWTWTRVS